MNFRPRIGRPCKSSKDNIDKWTGQSLFSLLHITDDISQWATVTAEASVGIDQRRPGVTELVSSLGSCSCLSPFSGMWKGEFGPHGFRDYEQLGAGDGRFRLRTNGFLFGYCHLHRGSISYHSWCYFRPATKRFRSSVNVTNPDLMAIRPSSFDQNKSIRNSKDEWMRVLRLFDAAQNRKLRMWTNTYDRRIRQKTKEQVQVIT